MNDPATPQDRFASEGTSRMDDVVRLLREEAICAMKSDPPDLGRVRELMDIYERIRREASIPIDNENALRDAIANEVNHDRGMGDYIPAGGGVGRLRVSGMPRIPTRDERIMDKVMEMARDFMHDYNRMRQGTPERRAMNFMRLARIFQQHANRLGSDPEEKDRMANAARVCRQQAAGLLSSNDGLERSANDGTLHHDMDGGCDPGTQGGEGNPAQGRAVDPYRGVGGEPCP